MPGAQFKAVYVPRFGSQSSRCWSSQTSGRQLTDEYSIELPSEERKQGRLSLSTTKKVKLTKCIKPIVKMNKVKTGDILRKSPVLEVQRMTSISQREGTRQSSPNQCISTKKRGGPQTVNEDVFSFSQSNEATSNKAGLKQGSARLSVLRTISRMLQENQVIRERLLPLTPTRYYKVETD